ncbi:hypothetical protein [Burkholderia sp. AU30280]
MHPVTANFARYAVGLAVAAPFPASVALGETVGALAWPRACFS